MATVNYLKKLNKIMAFLGLPLFFVVVSYIFIYFIASPVLAPLYSILKISIGNTVPSFDDPALKEEFVDLFSEDTSNDVINGSIVNFPKYGEQYAKITISGTKVDCPVFYGDSDNILRKGAAQYIGSKLPGFSGTILIGAHMTNYFMDLESAKVGDIIEITTTYGKYQYKINGFKIAKPDDKSAYDLAANYENLILYTCYPFGYMGHSQDRYFVYASLVSGPKVDLSK